MGDLTVWVWFTVGSIFILAMLLTMAVWRSLTNPAHRVRFEEALAAIQRGEVQDDLDTALTQSGEKKPFKWFPYWAEATAMSGAKVKDPKAPGRTAIGVAVAGAGLGYVGAAELGVLAGLVAGPLLMKVWLGFQANKRVTAMEKQLPDLLSAMRASLQAGETPQQALMSAADGFPAPLGEELNTMKRNMDVNVQLDTALNQLASRVRSREMQFLTSSIIIAVRSGADLGPQVETIQQIVVQRTRIRATLRAAVAKANSTAYLAYAAVPVMFFISTRNPDNQSFFFTTTAGLISLVAMIILYVLGVFLIRTIVKGVENT